MENILLLMTFFFASDFIALVLLKKVKEKKLKRLHIYSTQY